MDFVFLVLLPLLLIGFIVWAIMATNKQTRMVKQSLEANKEAIESNNKLIESNSQLIASLNHLADAIIKK